MNIYEGLASGVSQNQFNDDSHLLPPSGRSKKGKHRKKPRDSTTRDNATNSSKTHGTRKLASKSCRQPNDLPNRKQGFNSMQEFTPVGIEELRQLLQSMDNKTLSVLDLSHRNLEDIPYVFSDITKNSIIKVNLSNNYLKELPAALHLPNLQDLNLSFNFIHAFELKIHLPFLLSLDLSSNKMTKFPSPEVLDCLPNLRSLNLYDNLINAIPTKSFEKLTKLEELNLSYNKLAFIPKEISALISLRILLLDKNDIRSLPDSITQLNLEDSTFEISGNKLAYPPQEVADRGFSAVKRYILLLQQEQQLRISELSINSTTPVQTSFSSSLSSSSFLASSPLTAQPIPVNTPIPKKRKSIRLNEDVTHEPPVEQPTRSSQYKLIVVGRERAGKTSTIRFLTRNVVMVTGGSHEEVFLHPKYGKLLDVYDSERYLVRLFPEQSDVICRAEHIRLATSSPNETNNFDFSAVGPPQSTIGIDIDVWKPAITYSLLQSQATIQSAAQPIDRPVAVVPGPKSYASALLSQTTELQTKAPGNPIKSLKKEGIAWTRSSLPISEGFEIYESSRTLDGYLSNSETTAGTNSKPGSYNRKGNRPPKMEPMKTEKKTCFEGKPPIDLTLSIWDFAGQDIYHAAHEVFFSPRALYLVVWDMTHNTIKHFDDNVQFWIDLIQIRAPGSTIIIVGTKSDLIAGGPAEVQNIISQLSKRLAENEKIRLNSIIKECRKSQNPLLQRLVKQRPKISKILPVSCTESLWGFSELTKAILELSTPTSKHPNPFQLVNIDIPRYYLEVKEEVESMLRTCSVTNMTQLHNNMIEKLQKQTQFKDRIGDMSINDTRDAVTFLSSIGEVVWFGSTHKRSHQQSKTEVVVAIEDFVDDDDPPPPEPLNIMSLRNQISVTSVQSDVSFNMDSEYYSDNGPSSHRTSASELGGDSDTWRDVGGSDSEKNLTIDKSDNDRSQSRKSTPVNNSDDLSDIIFLSPHWLLQSMKKILTHHLEDDIKAIIRSMDDDIKRSYFGGNDNEYVPNGIVRWKFIEEKLLRDIDLPPEDRIRGLILSALRSLLKKFDIIIPLDMSSRSSTKDSTDHEAIHDSDYFLIPSLLSTLDIPAIPQYAAPGYLKLERRYILDKFIPPGLLQRIMARTYFKFGSTRLSLHDSAPLTKNCWKYAFHQGFNQTNCDIIDIWVWLDTEVNQIRLVGFGNIFMSQEIIKRLDKYSQAVTDILATFPGLCNIGEIVVCPVCTMHQRSPAHCGSFTSDDIQQLKKTLKKLEQHHHNQSLNHLESPPKRVRSHSVDSECSEVNYTDHTEDLLSWRHLKRVCRRHLCGVDSNLLVAIPKSLFTQKNFAQRSEFTIEFLMEELVRLSSVPSSTVENCVCKVGHSFSLTENFNSRMRAIQNYYTTGSISDDPLTLYANITDQASGVYVTLPVPSNDFTSTSANPSSPPSPTNLKMVISCEHVIHPEKVKSGCSDYFLIGDEHNWLFFATLIFKGSDYPQGSREIFQAGNESYPLPMSRQYTKSLSDPGSTIDYKLNGRRNPPPANQKLFDRKIWDVAALSIICPIEPVAMTQTNFSIKLLLVDELSAQEGAKPSPEENPSSGIAHRTKSDKKRRKSKSYVEISSSLPAVEQSLRLIGYQHMMSISITWGRVMQTNANGLIMVNLYGDNGTSGGAIVDREGKLIGLLSKSTTGKQVAYIEPISPICRVLFKHQYQGRNCLHFSDLCTYCLNPPSPPHPSLPALSTSFSS